MKNKLTKPVLLLLSVFAISFDLFSQGLPPVPGGIGTPVALEEHYSSSGDEKMYNDNCLTGETRWTVLGRIPGTSNEWHFNIWTRGILGK